jgi:Ni,Fe-hydrogenase III small subunit
MLMPGIVADPWGCAEPDPAMAVTCGKVAGVVGVVGSVGFVAVAGAAVIPVTAELSVAPVVPACGPVLSPGALSLSPAQAARIRHTQRIRELSRVLRNISRARWRERAA